MKGKKIQLDRQLIIRVSAIAALIFVAAIFFTVLRRGFAQSTVIPIEEDAQNEKMPIQLAQMGPLQGKSADTLSLKAPDFSDLSSKMNHEGKENKDCI